jgi:aminopeptidase N
MKALITLFFIGSLSAIGWGQHLENHNYCSKRDAFKNHQLKSNTLTVAQIDETEKYDVHYYALDLKMSNLSTDIIGICNINAKSLEAIDSVLFELFSSLTITQIRFNGVPVNFSRTGSAVYVPVNIPANTSFKIDIDYNGTPPTATTNPLGGSGMTNATSPSWGNQVTWSLSQPFSAYEWWPCKQSLTDKADSCAVKVTVPSNCKAGSNGKLMNVVDLGNGTTRYEWKHRHAIDYYLISVAVAKYVEYNVLANPAGSTSPVLIQNFIYDNPATLANFQSDIDETADFMELFAGMFGPYPFDDEKYGHCMAPLSGGMEHQTMTTQGFFEKSLTAHELGHQWWGDNVTCASWADIWVNEGFASYSDYLMIENLYPAERAQYMTDVHTSVMTQPDGSVYVLDSLNENRIFSGRLSYDKGSAIIHTLRFVVDNDPLFFQTLRNFQNTFADSVAKGLDVKEAFEASSGLDLNDFFNQWYFGQGYPTYSARWNQIGSDLLLEITHTSSAPFATSTFTNPLEIRFTRSGQPDTTIRFDVSANTCQYLVSNAGTVSSLAQFDPNNWVINKSGTKVYDPNFFLTINENDMASGFKLYPNPVEDDLNIVAIDKNTAYQVYITDANGKRITSGLFKDQLTLSTSTLDHGKYVLSLFKENQLVEAIPFIKQ